MKHNWKPLWLILTIVLFLVACQEIDSTSSPTLEAVTNTPTLSTSTPLPPSSTPTPSPTPITPTLSPPTPTQPPPERLMFLSGFTLYSINSDGSDLQETNLLEPYMQIEQAATYLALSPDGRYLAFDGVSQIQPCGLENTDCFLSNYGIFVADLSQETVIGPTGSFETNPSWAPDSQQFVVPLRVNVTEATADNPFSANLFILKVENSALIEVNRLTENLSLDIYPSWSPDGQWIAFLRYVRSAHPKWPHGCERILSSPECHKADLYLVRPDGSELKLLISDVYVDEGLYHAPLWSPNSQSLVVRMGDGGEKIVLLDLAAGKEEILFEDTTGYVAYMSWAPDNKQLLISFIKGTTVAEIYKVAIEKKTTESLITSSGAYLFPVWSPGGSRVAFISWTGFSQLAIMSVESKNMIILSRLEKGRPPIWVP